MDKDGARAQHPTLHFGHQELDTLDAIFEGLIYVLFFAMNHPSSRLQTQAQDFVYGALQSVISDSTKRCLFYLNDYVTPESSQRASTAFTAIRDRIQFPIDFPPSCKEHIVLINEELPALMLTPDVCTKLAALAKASHRVRRLESIYAIDNEMVNCTVDNINNKIMQLEDKAAMMTRIIQESEDHGNDSVAGGCPYSAQDVEEVKDKIAEEEEFLKGWIDENDKAREELGREEREAWLHSFGFVDLIEKPLQVAGILPSERDSWLRERQTLGFSFHHIFSRLNTLGHPFLKSFHDAQWRARGQPNNDFVPPPEDGQYLDDQTGRDAETVDILNHLDICHWNRRVAQEDFQHMDVVITARENELEEEFRKGHASMPSKEEFDLLKLSEKRRLTKTLMLAETAYRDAVRRTRARGQSVDTCDSSHISVIASGNGSVPAEELQRVATDVKPKVQNWTTELYPPLRSGLDNVATLDGPFAPCPTPTAATSIHIMDSYSAIAGLRGIRTLHAKRKRASEKLMVGRDIDHFAKRTRCCYDSQVENSSPRNDGTRASYDDVADASAGVNDRSPPRRCFMSKPRRQQWPDDAFTLREEHRFARRPHSVGTASQVLSTYVTQSLLLSFA